MALGRGGDACALGVLVDGGFEGSERAAEFAWCGWFVGVEEWTQQPVLEFGVEHGDADAFGGELVAVFVGEALDESVQAQPAEGVGHLALGLVRPGVSADEPAKAFVGEAGDGWQEVAEGAGQSHGALIPEAQGSGSLALVVGLVDALVERRADGTALTGFLDHKQPLVDLAGFVDELRQVVQAGADVDVGWLVDDGLDAERAAALQILLDAGVLVAELDTHLGPRGEDAGAVGVAGGAAELGGGRGGGHRAPACPTHRLGASRAPTNIRRRDRSRSAVWGSA